MSACNAPLQYSEFVAMGIYANGRFRYDKPSFGSTKTKTKITCLKHGAFWQNIGNHINRRAGCPECAKEATGRRCQLGSQAMKVALQKTLGENYVVVRAPAGILGDAALTCLLHNCTYEVPATSVLHSGVIGCRVCAGITYRYEVIADMFLLNKGKNRILPSEDRTLSKQFEGECPKHGKFRTFKLNLLETDWGCPKCNKEAGGRLNHQRNGITVSQAVADLFYYVKGRYQLVSTVAKDMDVEFKLVCPNHGEFSITWKKYIKGGKGGFGCPVCGGAHGSASIARTAISKHAESFHERASRLNPHLRVVGTYSGVFSNIAIECVEGHVTSIPARRLIEDKGFKSRCETCYGIYRVSQPEMDIGAMLRAFDIPFDPNNRKILGGKELDIYIPGLNIAIEYNGAIWHSEKYGRDRHAMNKKRVRCLELGIRLINICSSIPKKVAMNLIASAVGINLERYYARSCTAELLRSADPRIGRLYADNHVQGAVKGCVTYGLFFRGELVSAMSFSSVNSERGTKKSLDRWELRRYAGYGTVVGGASKLLKTFLRAHSDCKEIISYSDNSLFTGGMYEKLGFQCVSESKPDYGYTRNGGAVHHKSKFSRARLATRSDIEFDPRESEVANCWRNKWYRIWDCGKKKWSLTL